MTNPLYEMTIGELGPMLKNRLISPLELTESVLSRAKRLNPVLNNYIRIDEEEAMEAAKAAEAELASGNYRGILHGIPLALKDIFYFKGKVATMGSKIHADFRPDYDAAVVEKLRRAGAIFTGTLAMHEYAYGATTDNPHYGTCHNPWDMKVIPGGSSGGSGSAVAADMTIASLGTDTGGSVRIPSSMCGIVGLKPTHGRISKRGVFPLSFSLDHVGPMTKDVRDAAILLEVLSGYDELDPTAAAVPASPYSTDLTEEIRGKIIGIEEMYFFQNLDPGVERQVRAGIRTLESLGAKLVPVSIPSLRHVNFVQTVTCCGDANAIHYDNIRSRIGDFGEDLRLFFRLGELISAADYVRAQQIRQKIKEEYKEVFRQVDAMIVPTLPYTAPEIGKNPVLNDEEVSVFEYNIRFNSPSNLTGYPAISVPCGLSGGLPVGMQIIGNAFAEQTILNLAYAFEQTDPMQGRKPEL